MKFAVLTTPEPIYYPAFFDRLLEQRQKDCVGIFLFPCLAKDKKERSLVWQFRRFTRSFGLLNALKMALRVVMAKIKDKLRIGYSKRQFYSIESTGRYYGVPVRAQRDVNDPGFIAELEKQGVDMLLSVSCPQIFKEELIEMPKLGCLNIHGADLPEYRGLMPSFWMMAHGLETAAASIFFVNAGIDTGDIIGKRFFPILPEDTLDSFIVRSRREACDLALDAMDQIEAGTVTRTPLQGKGSYYGWPTREAYKEFRRQGRKMW